MWHDLYWGGKHAAGEEREQAQAGRGEPGMFFPGRGRGHGQGKQSPPARAARGPRTGDRAAAGGAATRGFRACNAGGQGPATPAGARARRGPHAPGRGGLGGASSLLGERGDGRPVKPGPESGANGVGEARRPREELEEPRRLRERAPPGQACSGISHRACGAVWREPGPCETRPRPREEVRPVRAQPVLQLLGA